MLNKLISNTYGLLEWQCIKIHFILFWLGAIYSRIHHYDSIPFPVGICSLFNCDCLMGSFTRPVSIFLVVILAISYVLEWRMMITTLLIGLLSLFWFTVEESNGIYPRTALLSFIFFTQFFAYALKKRYPSFNINQYRIQFPIQAIAASYTLAAISKLHDSGFAWVTDGPNISIQVLKSNMSNYFTSGNVDFLIEGHQTVSWLMTHHSLIYLALGFSLILELFCIIGTLSKRSALIYGLLLFSMHIGIALLMKIFIFPVAIPMLIFMVNPFYLLIRAVLSIPIFRGLRNTFNVQ